MLIDEIEFIQVSCMYWYIGNMGNPTLLLNAYCNWTIPSHDSRLVKITEIDHFECHLLLWFPSLFRFFSATCLGGVPSRKKVLRATLEDPWVGRLVSCEKSHLMEKHLNSHCKSSNNAVYLGLRILFQREKTISWSWQFPSHSTRLTRPSVFFVGGVCFGGGMRTAIYTQPLEVQLFAGWGTCHLMTSAQTLRNLFRFNYFSRWPPVVVRGVVHPSWRPLGRLRTSSALSIGDWVVKTLKKYPYIYIYIWLVVWNILNFSIYLEW